MLKNKIHIALILVVICLSCGKDVDTNIVRLESELTKGGSEKATIELSLRYAYKDFDHAARAERLIKDSSFYKNDDAISNIVLALIFLQKSKFEENMIKMLMWGKIGLNHLDKASYYGGDNIAISTIALFINAHIPPELARYRFVEENKATISKNLKLAKKKLSSEDSQKIEKFMNYYVEMGIDAEKCINEKSQGFFKNRYSFSGKSFFSNTNEEMSYFLYLINREVSQ